MGVLEFGFNNGRLDDDHVRQICSLPAAQYFFEVTKADRVDGVMFGDQRVDGVKRGYAGGPKSRDEIIPKVTGRIEEYGSGTVRIVSQQVQTQPMFSWVWSIGKGKKGEGK